VGSWLRRLKHAIWEGAADDMDVLAAADGRGDVAPRAVSLGQLKRELVTITRGQKIMYIADCAGTKANLQRLAAFAQGADVVYCEAAFLDADRDKAAARGHLTARQAGEVARRAGARALRVFHFSPRYEQAPQMIYDEARTAFDGGA
jgi:ribonuclease Z